MTEYQFFPSNEIPDMLPEVSLEVVDFVTMLKDNKNRNCVIYMSFPSAIEWRDKKHEGKIKEVGTNYVIIYSMAKWLALPIKNIDYIEFSEPYNYLSNQL